MKLVPGYMFRATKSREDFKVGELYRIYHIAPIKEGVEYLFQSSSGNIKQQFESTALAEAFIGKIAGNKTSGKK